MSDQPMTRRDREDLQRVARMRAKVAKDGVAAQEAARLADVEEQLSAVYEFDDCKCAAVTRAAAEAVRAADEKIAAICRAEGIPERFRPEIHTTWYSRGENAAASCRAELRKLAQSKIAADAKRAKAQIEAKATEVQTELIVGGLDTDAARAFVESIPTPDQLMPTYTVAQLESAMDSGSGKTERPYWLPPQVEAGQ